MPNSYEVEITGDYFPRSIETDVSLVNFDT